jgi:predicted ATPase
MYILQERLDGSLIVIEEIELGFHPETLIRLAKHLQEIILKKKLQAVVSTHFLTLLIVFPEKHVFLFSGL